MKNSTDDNEKNNDIEKKDAKQLYRCFKRQTKGFANEMFWFSLAKEYLKRETASLLVEADRNSIRITYIMTEINSKILNIDDAKIKDDFV